MAETTTSGAAGTPLDGLGWLPQSVRPLLDTLSDAVVAVNTSGFIVYANPAAEHLLGWLPGQLVGNPVAAFVPAELLAGLEGGFQGFANEVADTLVGVHLEITALRLDGTELLTELMVTVIDDRLGGRVVLGTIRERASDQFGRWSELTNQLLDTLIEGSTAELPEQRLLADLGVQLDWDFVALWTMAQSAELFCRHVWCDPRLEPGEWAERVRPPRASDGATLPLHVLHSGETLWVPDLSQTPQFADGPAARSGITSAMVFPIRYRGAVVGVVELLNRTAKPFDPGLDKLLGAISDPLGQLLVAVEQVAERESLLAKVEAARRTQDFLLRASRVLAEASDFRDTLDSLAQVAVPIIADLCLIDLLDEDGRLRRAACRHYDPTKRSLVEELRRDFPPDPEGLHPSIAAATLGQPSWSPEMSDSFLRSTTRSERHFQVIKELQFTSYMVVPLIVKENILGSLTLVSAGSGRRFNEDDLVSAQQLAGQVASVLERARRHERDHRVSHTLQHSLLPDSLPEVSGIDLIARYLPASDYTEVGGDWYDAFSVGRRLALVIGDVEGHDVAAASVMGNVRVATKAFMIEDPSPAGTLARLNHFVVESNVARLATVLIALLDPMDGVVVLSTAGHPPPVMTDGTTASLVDLKVGPPIGIAAADYHETRTSVAGKTIAFYTDGLIEARGHAIDEGVDAVRRALLANASLPLDDLVEAILGVAGGNDSRRDDIALLVARASSPPSCRKD